MVDVIYMKFEGDKAIIMLVSSVLFARSLVEDSVEQELSDGRYAILVKCCEVID